MLDPVTPLLEIFHTLRDRAHRTGRDLIGGFHRNRDDSDPIGCRTLPPETQVATDAADRSEAVLDEDDLGPADEKLLDLLDDGV